MALVLSHSSAIQASMTVSHIALLTGKVTVLGVQRAPQIYHFLKRNRSHMALLALPLRIDIPYIISQVIFGIFCLTGQVALKAEKTRLCINIS